MTGGEQGYLLPLFPEPHFEICGYSNEGGESVGWKYFLIYLRLPDRSDVEGLMYDDRLSPNGLLPVMLLLAELRSR